MVAYSRPQSGHAQTAGGARGGIWGEESAEASLGPVSPTALGFEIMGERNEGISSTRPDVENAVCVDAGKGKQEARVGRKRTTEVLNM